MLGNLLKKIRKDRNITKSSLAKDTNINIGHLTHIEKGERNPSHKSLRSICKYLDVPYRQVAYTYDRELSEDHLRYKVIDHISYNKVLAIDSIKDFIECPSNIPNASLAFKITDDSMEPSLEKNSYAFLEFNAPLDTKDIGLFQIGGKYIIRRFIIRKDALILRPDNKKYEEISISENDNFIIIGKVYPSK